MEIKLHIDTIDANGALALQYLLAALTFKLKKRWALKPLRYKIGSYSNPERDLAVVSFLKRAIFLQI